MLIKILFTLVAFMCLLRVTAWGQFGIQYSYIAPSGDNVFIFNPGSGIELKYTTGVIDTSRTRFSFALGYYKLNPTQDSFPYYQVQNGKLYPGYDIIKSYAVIPVSAGIEYHPFEGKLTPYVGIDLNFSFISYKYQSYIESIRNSNTTENDWALGAFPKIGISYQFGQNWLLAGGIGYNFGLASSTSTNNQSFLRSFLCLSYYINPKNAPPK